METCLWATRATPRMTDDPDEEPPDGDPDGTDSTAGGPTDGASPGDEPAADETAAGAPAEEATDDGSGTDEQAGDGAVDDREPEEAEAVEEGTVEEGTDDGPGTIEPLEEVTPEAVQDRLGSIADALEAAETEAEIDAVEEDLDAVAGAVEGADLPEPDDGGDPAEELAASIEELRDDIEEARGPYAREVVESIADAAATVRETRWTETGSGEVADAVEAFLSTAGDVVGETAAESREPEALATALEEVSTAVEEAGYDPDAHAETIAALVDAASSLEGALDDAEEWDDLQTRDQLRAQGFFDVLGHYKDFPVEWAALKEHEKQGNVDMILLALESLQSDFLEEHCLEALERLGRRAATDEGIETMIGRAERRDRPAIRILGKMAAAEATDVLVEYVDEDSNPQLQKVTFRALGEIGAPEAVEPLVGKLAMDNDNVRPYAARALGLVGDTRAVEPLARTLDEDESDDVRAAAAWALRAIGTEEALAAAAEHTDARSFVVQTEARKAERELAGGAKPV